jgi:hypothetical protein
VLAGGFEIELRFAVFEPVFADFLSVELEIRA